MSTVAEARALARHYLAESLPRRWAHVQGVAAAASVIASRLPVDRNVLVAAAWVHDIGYAPELEDSGFHPIDGARLLRRHQFDERVVCLVAHHTGAWEEADERGMLDILEKEFPREESATADALWYCDLTIGPFGTPVAPHARLAEIKARYGPNAVVTRFVDRAEEQLLGAVQRTEHRLSRREALGIVSRDMA